MQVLKTIHLLSWQNSYGQNATFSHTVYLPHCTLLAASEATIKNTKQFIWNAKKPHAGLGAPNIMQYHKAAILSPLHPWWKPDDTKLGYAEEKDITPQKLKDLLGAVALGFHPPPFQLATVNTAVKT